MQKFFCIFSCISSENAVYCGPNEIDFGGTHIAMEHPTWNTLRSYGAVAGLACVMGLSYQLFVFPNAFAPAGINGLATMLQYLLHVSIGYLSLLINLPLILLAWKKVDPDFARKTLTFVLAFSAVNLILGRMDLSALAYHTGSSAILGPVAAGVVSGAVYGWVIRRNGSTGGTDIVAAWVRKKRPEASLVWMIFTLNASVAVLSFFVYGCQFEPVILCLIYCYLSSSISDTILKGGKSAMKFEVITRQPEELSRQLLQQAPPRCHSAPGGGDVLRDAPVPADLRGEPPSGGAVPGDPCPLPGHLRLRLQRQRDPWQFQARGMKKPDREIVAVRSFFAFTGPATPRGAGG